MKSIVPFGFLCVWSAFVLGFNGIFVYHLYYQWRSLGYAATSGVITHSEIEESSDGDEGTSYIPRLKFNYSVANTQYTGKTYHYGTLGAGRDFAEEIVANHPVGAKVDVYYDPADPTNAVLKRGILPIDLFAPFFMTPFNMVMIGGWLFAIKEFIRKRRNAPAGGVPIFYYPGKIHVRFAEVEPTFIAIATAGLSSFVCIFILAFATGMNPSMAWVGLASLVVVAFSAIAFAWSWLVLKSGRKDLIIDESSGWVTFPQTMGRKRLITAEFDTIDSIEVVAVKDNDSENPGVNYVPTIVCETLNGGRKHEQLIKWKSREDADALAKWLSENIPLRS